MNTSNEATKEYVYYPLSDGFEVSPINCEITIVFNKKGIKLKVRGSTIVAGSSSLLFKDTNCGGFKGLTAWIAITAGDINNCSTKQDIPAGTNIASLSFHTVPTIGDTADFTLYNNSGILWDPEIVIEGEPN
ncbi:MAG: hypothetical protein ACI9FJ_000624 [Alteromonadaceae bacterium]|jgi:hypothetical protein